MCSLRHPSIVTFLGVCPVPPCVVTEYCARGSLADVLRNARQSPAAAVKLDWLRRVYVVGCKLLLLFEWAGRCLTRSRSYQSDWQGGGTDLAGVARVTSSRDGELARHYYTAFAVDAWNLSFLALCPPPSCLLLVVCWRW